MKKILFIDRDGTIIKEPADDFQVDSFEKLEFLPFVLRNLYQIYKNLDFEFVMVTNQDGLGSDSFPENTFWPVHNKMLKILKNEGIIFSEILIDRSFPKDNLPTRKPNTGLLQKYLDGYDLKNSFVIGDRITDIELAKNLGCNAIFLGKNDINENEYLKNVLKLQTSDWNEIYNFLKLPTRSITKYRKTKETDIKITINLDNEGNNNIDTGLGFFDHMLEQIAKYSNCNFDIFARGDLKVDEHHTIEDTAILLGECFLEALGNKKGIERYGFVLPMDDSLAQIAIDFSGRPFLVWDVRFNREMVGDIPTELFKHFFKSFSDSAKCNINVKCDGENTHHIVEAIFKSFGKVIKMAVKRNRDDMQIPSTKGML